MCFRSGYTADIGTSGASLRWTDTRFVFSVRVEDVQLGAAGPPGGAEGWRAVASVLRSCEAQAGGLLCGLRDDFVTTMFPADCRMCDQPMAAWRASPVCDACEAAAAANDEAHEAMLCSLCGEALEMESARLAEAWSETRCPNCRMQAPPFTRAVAFGTYEDHLREMVFLLKYERMQRLASGVLSDWLASAMLQVASDAASEMTVIAVPLFAARERQRGFNQSALLADAAIRRVKKLRPEWKLRARHSALARIKDTREQFVLSPEERQENLRDAFSVTDAAAVRGREVMLVDDILTTGATARECSRVLLLAGAVKVWVVTLARAQPESGVARWV